MPDPAGIEIENLSKSYAGVTALDVERLAVAPRSTLALIGPSGCGKSTLLKLVVGLLTPDRGRISIGGTPMTPDTRRALQLRMGYVIQEGGLFPHLTAAENTALDPMIRSDLQRDLREVFGRLRKTVLFVTHDMAEAAFIAGEMAIMRSGRILQRGTFRDLVRNPNDPFVTEFIRAQRPLDLAGATA